MFLFILILLYVTKLRFIFAIPAFLSFQWFLKMCHLFELLNYGHPSEKNHMLSVSAVAKKAMR